MRQAVEKRYFVYMLECVNGAYYTGYTTDIERRYQEHLSGSFKCKYTRSFPPIRIAACWQVAADLSQTLKIECYIKKVTKRAKQALVANPSSLEAVFTMSSCYPAFSNVGFDR
jgi:putative endonuclease